MNERIKKLRLYLKLNQEEFSNKLKLSRSHLSSIEVGTKSLTDRVIADVCREFDVNEKWLKEGSGEMFIETGKDELIDLQKKYNLDGIDLLIVTEYINLSKEKKEVFKDYFYNVFKKEWEKKQTEPQLTKEELDELEIQKELAEFEEAVRTQKNRDKNNLSNINYLENMDYFKEKKPA